MNWQTGNREARTPWLGPARKGWRIAVSRQRGLCSCHPALLGIVVVALCVPSFARRSSASPELAISGPNAASGSSLGGEKGSAHSQPSSRPHLAQWLNEHRDMPLNEQERALRNEPGFGRLPVARQQRLLKRLQQLNAMPRQQRARTLQRMEALEKLSPQQREQLRQVVREVGGMPQPRQRMMHKAFHDLSQLPPEQRDAVLDSPQFKSQFSDRERQILGTLMSVQPYQPAQAPNVEYGGK